MTTLLLSALIITTAGVLWRYIRSRRRLDRFMLLGPRWSYHRTLPTERVPDEDMRIGGERAHWRAMGHLHREDL